MYVFDLKTYADLGSVVAADDADGTIFDPATGKVFVACGDAGSLVSIPADVDPKSGKADPAVDLGGKPEFLAADGQGKVYVNLVDKNEVAVVDTKEMKVVAKWPTAPGTGPAGLSMDTAGGRLYVGCHNQKMIVMNAKDGTVLADLPIGRGVDATAFDRGSGLASCGDGTLTVVRETSPDKFEVVQSLKHRARRADDGRGPRQRENLPRHRRPRARRRHPARRPPGAAQADPGHVQDRGRRTNRARRRREVTRGDDLSSGTPGHDLSTVPGRPRFCLALGSALRCARH